MEIRMSWPCTTWRPTFSVRLKYLVQIWLKLNGSGHGIVMIINRVCRKNHTSLTSFEDELSDIILTLQLALRTLYLKRKRSSIEGLKRGNGLSVSSRRRMMIHFVRKQKGTHIIYNWAQQLHVRLSRAWTFLQLQVKSGGKLHSHQLQPWNSAMQ